MPRRKQRKARPYAAMKQVGLRLTPGGQIVMKRPAFRKSRTEKHEYTRYMRDLVLQNTWTGSPAVSDIVFNVDNNPQGKNYLGFHLGNLISDVNGTSQIGGAMSFRMSALPQLLDFETLYDRYKLRGVKIVITPLSNFASAANLGTLPVISYAYDNDDTAVPANNDVIRQYGTCKIKRLDKPVKIWLRPKLLLAGAGASAGEIVSSPKFIDMGDVDVDHYGVKFWINNMLLGNTATINSLFRVTAKYYFTCQATR